MLAFLCLNELIYWSEKFAINIISQKFFSITWTIFSHSRSEQFLKQNTNSILDHIQNTVIKIQVFLCGQKNAIASYIWPEFY